MTNILRRSAFDRPFDVRCVNGEILMVSRQAPVEVVLTAQSARATGLRLLLAAQALEDSAAADAEPTTKDD